MIVEQDDKIGIVTFLRRVLIMNSRAKCVAGCASRGRIRMLLSSGSPGTIWKQNTNECFYTIEIEIHLIKNEMTHAHLPVVEYRQAERLTLGVRSKVSLEAERIDGGKESLDDVERRARDWRILRHVTTSTCQHGVDGGNTVSRCLYFDEVVRLHETRSCLKNISKALNKLNLEAENLTSLLHSPWEKLSMRRVVTWESPDLLHGGSVRTPWQHQGS